MTDINPIAETEEPTLEPVCNSVDFCAYYWMGQSQGQHLYYALECQPPNNPRSLYSTVYKNPPPGCATPHDPDLCYTVREYRQTVAGRQVHWEELPTHKIGHDPLRDYHDPVRDRPARGAYVPEPLEFEFVCKIGGHEFGVHTYVFVAEIPDQRKLLCAMGFERRVAALSNPSPINVADSNDLGRYAFRIVPYGMHCPVFTHRVVPR